jgi:HK97 family phage prohead protease
MTEFVRSYALEDISIRSGGDGRTVEAYAAVFNVPQRIVDGQGTYLEVIDRTAFNKTLADKGTRFGVFYNHGRTIWGTPSDAYSMPIGTPEKIVADERGLLTVTRYNNTPVADQVLEGIRTGAISAQSFSGSFVRSDIAPPRGGFKPAADGSLKTVTRMEIAMREYGPTPFPAYEAAAILGVRAEELAATISNLDESERAELVRLLQVSAIRLDEVEADVSTSPEAAAEEPITAPAEDHSARLHQFQSLRVSAREKGVL